MTTSYAAATPADTRLRGLAYVTTQAKVVIRPGHCFARPAILALLSSPGAPHPLD